MSRREQVVGEKTGAVSKALIYILLAVLTVTIVVPVAWVFMASVKQNSEFYGNPFALPQGIYLQNFADAWVKARMGDYFFTSILITAVALAILLIVALPAAYVLSRYKFWGSKLLNTCFMAGLFINVSYIVVPIFLMFVSGDKIVKGIFGHSFFLNNPFMVSLVLASTTLPFTIYLLSSYLATLPKDYEEAAYVDGAGYFTTMVRIILPMAKPSIITVILFEFLAYWNEYIISMTMLTDPNGARTLPVGLLNLMKAQNAKAEYGQMYAGMVMVMIPTLVLYMCVQKKLTQGMTLGGLKG
ncbi:carbohydrate ABC transporter permease [uncultured Ruthenibacterium sp.]|uniref:carbohydrate ABC transporter permease n=1 Tax=uncultured Ruthenibacterium sp. TaxID=1905347 RepID=UPI00349EB49D